MVVDITNKGEPYGHHTDNNSNTTRISVSTTRGESTPRQNRTYCKKGCIKMARRIIEISELKNVQSGFKVVFGDGDDMKELTYLAIVEDHALFMEGFASPINGYCSIDYGDFITSSRKLIESIFNIEDGNKVTVIKRISNETTVSLTDGIYTQDISLTINPFLHDSHVALVLDGAEWKLTDLIEFPFATYMKSEYTTIEASRRYNNHFTEMCLESKPTVSVIIDEDKSNPIHSIVFDLTSVIYNDEKFKTLWRNKTSDDFIEIIETLKLYDDATIIEIDESLAYFKLIGINPEHTPTIISMVWNSIKNTIGY